MKQESSAEKSAQKALSMNSLAGSVIRLLAESDSLEELTELLHRAYAPLGERGWNYTAVDQDVGRTQRRVSRGECYVAELNGCLVGTITVEPTSGASECAWFRRAGVASAHQFAVAPELQGKGLGTQLILQVEKWATEKGYEEIAVDTAEPANHLIEFYQQRGYRLVDFVQWAGKHYRSVVLSKRLRGGL